MTKFTQYHLDYTALASVWEEYFMMHDNILKEWPIPLSHKYIYAFTLMPVHSEETALMSVEALDSNF
jgi:hypothetical protein